VSDRQKKIIHVDMDCFYAAVEIRDDPSLATEPVAVGGSADHRGVLCTCNYIARQFGVRSAMSTAYAYRLCKNLIVLPVNMPKYKEAAGIIQRIFREFTDLVEPLSLDEAYLDVSDSSHLHGSATLIAKEIRARILKEVGLTASAGVAPNKFLAKIASGWKKPNGLFVILPDDVSEFVKTLPVKNLFGVGKVTAEKLHKAGFNICADLHDVPLTRLIERYGKFGKQLYEQSRGIDNRSVEPNRIRKSLSVEETFDEDIQTIDQCLAMLDELHQRLIQRLNDANVEFPIKNQFIKIKYNDFKQATIERLSDSADLAQFKSLLLEAKSRPGLSIRLLGVGVRFQTAQLSPIYDQQTLF
jgi:DNA polymerase-4